MILIYGFIIFLIYIILVDEVERVGWGDALLNVAGTVLIITVSMYLLFAMGQSIKGI